MLLNRRSSGTADPTYSTVIRQRPRMHRFQVRIKKVVLRVSILENCLLMFSTMPAGIRLTRGYPPVIPQSSGLTAQLRVPSLDSLSTSTA